MCFVRFINSAHLIVVLKAEPRLTKIFNLSASAKQLTEEERKVDLSLTVLNLQEKLAKNSTQQQQEQIEEDPSQMSGMIFLLLIYLVFASVEDE